MKGAHSGEGLGNAFLSHIRAVDGIFQVVRVFDDADVTHVEVRTLMGSSFLFCSCRVIRDPSIRFAISKSLLTSCV